MDLRLTDEKMAEDEFYNNMKQLYEFPDENRYNLAYHRNFEIVAEILFWLRNAVKNLLLYLIVIILILLFK